MLKFDFLEKGLGIFSPQHFVRDFSRKCFCYILLANQISLSDCLNFVRYWPPPEKTTLKKPSLIRVKKLKTKIAITFIVYKKQQRTHRSGFNYSWDLHLDRANIISSNSLINFPIL